MAILRTYTVKASSLLESMVAMVVTLTIIVLGSLIYANVLKSDSLRIKLHVQQLFDAISSESRSKSIFLDTDIQDKWVRIHKSVIPYQGSGNLYVLKLTAYDKENSVLAEQKELIVK